MKEDRNIIQTKRRKANSIGHILPRNCCLKHVIVGKLEGRIEVTGRRRRRKQLPEGGGGRGGGGEEEEEEGGGGGTVQCKRTHKMAHCRIVPLAAVLDLSLDYRMNE